MSSKKRLPTLKAITLCLALNMSAPGAGFAASECAELAAAADKALADADRVISLKTKVIEAQASVISAQDKRVVEMEKEKPGLFSGPWLPFAAGVLAAVFVIRR